MPSLGLGLGLGLGPALSAAIVVAGDRSKPGRKHAERFLSSLASISTTIDPPHSPSSSSSSSLDRLSRKFLASCPKSAHAGALSHLISLSLSHSSSLSRLAALSLYRQLAASPHFPQRSPQLAPDLVPFLHEMGLSPDAQSLLSDAESRLNSRPEEIHALYCRLIEAFARRGMRESIFLLPRDRRSDDECMIKAFCLLGSPAEAQQVLTQMESPSPFHHRLVLQCYGEMGMTSAMEAMIGSGKVPLDTVCCNVVLSCYGKNGMLKEVLNWLRKMRDLGVVFSIRTCNSALNSCPGLSALLMGDDQSRPVSLEALMLQLGGDQEEEEEEEGMIVKELVGSRALLQTTMRWSSLEGKLDLHGYHLGSAFVAVLQLIDELKDRFLGNDVGIPRHIIIVCGSGKNSRNMGESPVKKMVSGVLFKLGSPFKIDRKNVGRLFAGGSAVRDWLLKLQAS